MNSIVTCPKTFDELRTLIPFYKNMYSDKELEIFCEWCQWFESFKDLKNPSLKEDEYFRIYFDLEKRFSLQVWKKQKDYNLIVYNLLTNYVDEFNTEDTIIK